MLDIDYLKKNNLIIFEAIVGSTSFGTNEANSDIDKKGVFILPYDMFLKNEIIEEVSDEKNDNVYYELSKFIKLLETGKTNALELLFSEDKFILQEHPLFKLIRNNKNIFLTKLLKNTFGRYAQSQIGKARGYNKKIVNPMSDIKKTPLDFCYYINNNQTYNLKKFLSDNNYKQLYCGVVKVPNAESVYALYYDEFSYLCFDSDFTENERKTNKLNYKVFFKHYNGIIKESDTELVSNDIRLSSIPKGEKCIGLFSYNKDGYSTYCKDYREYFEWKEKRNPVRYNINMEHAKGYDGKNLAHCHRLLDVCIEIGLGKGLINNRPNREQLLKIKHGTYEYDDLVKEAEYKLAYIMEIYETADLPETVDLEITKNMLYIIRKSYYTNAIS
jgi:hypothetical protein